MSDHVDLPRVIALVRRLRSTQIAHLIEVLERTTGAWPHRLHELATHENSQLKDEDIVAGLDDLQIRVGEWAKKAFGVEEAGSKTQRGIRLLEEAIELYQACGADRVMAHRLVDFVFGRPPGDINQEIGGVGITLLALAEAVECNADEEIFAEAERIFAKPPQYFAERNAAKNAAGFRAVTAGGRP